MNKFYIVYKRERERERAPGGLALLLVVMSFDGHFGQPMPVAMHRPIRYVVPYQWMCGDWHGLAKKGAKINLPWQVRCAMVRAAAACLVVVLH